ncbi:hypothetical protein AVEN_216588-1 [Araneus ventricosus]|uniref:Uncharacterized protein n=1 Tax=Araneus ventricosus TaxID=182803 RepID=A0A4Y2PJH0_ARAVE|nr:hypothetical protein AVEN_242849-1 [Araneus ventricosus]GBN51411.1 hypothetical protein AVEN_216588-1 [Araneus ventricosus]
MKIAQPGACANARRVSESVAKHYRQRKTIQQSKFMNVQPDILTCSIPEFQPRQRISQFIPLVRRQPVESADQRIVHGATERVRPPAE